LGLLLGVLLMIGLLAWFFLAKVTLYENSSTLQIQPDGQVVATFSEEGLRRVRQGQSVVLRIDQGADQPTLTLPAIVYDTQKGGGKVILYVFADELPAGAADGKLTGRAEVEVEYVTPAQLVIRATGRYLSGSAEIPVSPQTFVTPTPQGAE
jgi:hypothetical protein